MSTVNTYSSRNLTPLADPFTTNELNERLGQLDDNIRFIASIMETAREGSALWGFNARIEPGLQVGTPVFYDVAAGEFKASQLQLASSGGLVLAGPKAEVWGLIGVLCTEDKAHLLIDGIADVDLTASTGQAQPSGKWYLSATEGRLTRVVESRIVAPVLLATGQGEVLFRPWFADNFARFAPRQIRINHAPSAAVINNSGPITTLSGVDNTQAGWLPANDPVFNSTAPTGARFGYNWREDVGLQNIWPPISSEETRLLVDPGGKNSRGYTITLSGDPDRLIINDDGIWWMTDRTTQCPWDLPFTDSPGGGSPGGQVNPIDYPRQMAISGEFSTTSRSAFDQVYSLSTAIPWLKVRKAGTTVDAVRGDLELQLGPNDWIETTPPDLAGLALKQLTPEGKFSQGPAVAGLSPGTANVSLAGSQDPDGYFVGRVALSVAAAKDFDLIPLRRTLENATNESYKGIFMATGMRAGIDSSFTTEFYVARSVPANSELRFYITFLGINTINLPADIALEVTQVPDDLGVTSALPPPRAITLNYTVGATIPADEYVTAATERLAVSGGQTIYLKMTRRGSSDGEGGLLAVMQTIGQFVLALALMVSLF